MGTRRNNYYDATICRMVAKSLQEQEDAFLEQHRNDPEASLLRYIQENALRLGHTPHEKEILGSELILLRFGSWQEALCKAGLSPPTTPDRVTHFQRYIQEEKAQKERYAQKKAEKKELARIREQERMKKKQTQQNGQPE